MITVTTIKKQDAEFKNTFDRVLEFIANDFEHDFKLKENYSPVRLQFNDLLAISLYEDDDKVIGFSTVLYREIFCNGARILNRFLKSPNYRFVNNSKMKSFVTPETQEMIKQQIEVVRDAELDFAFMSREGKMPKNNMIHFTKSMPWMNWYIPEGRFHVCAGQEPCWQQICVAPISEDFDIEMEHMSKEFFRETFK